MNAKFALATMAAAAALTALPTGSAAADFTALSSIRAGNQAWSESLGMDFDVLSAITVTTLGAFDDLNNGFTGTIKVGIFDRNTSALVGNTATLTGMAGVAVGNQRFLDVADFNLAPGNYSIVAVGFGINDKNGNKAFGGTGSTINTGGGLINFVGSARYNNSGNFTLAFPTVVDTGPANRYDAGTFQFTAAVPEPSAYLMALLAAGMLAGVASRRKQS